MRAPVYKTIERPSRIFGLEMFDFFIWISSFTMLHAGRQLALLFSAGLWVALFALRYRTQPGFLLSVCRYYCGRISHGNRWSAMVREPRHTPWLHQRTAALGIASPRTAS